MSENDQDTRFLRMTEGDKSAWALCGINRYYGSKNIPDADFDFKFCDHDDDFLRRIFRFIRGHERGCTVVFFQGVDSFVSRSDNTAAANLMAVRCFRHWRTQHKKSQQSGVHVMGAMETHLAISRQDPDALYRYLNHEVLIIQAADYLLASERTQPGVLNSLMAFLEDRNNRGFYTILVCSGFGLVSVMHEADKLGPSVDYSAFRAFLLYRCLCILPIDRNDSGQQEIGIGQDFIDAMAITAERADQMLNVARNRDFLKPSRDSFKKRVLKKKRG